MASFFSHVLRNLDHLTNPIGHSPGLYKDVIVLRWPDKQERASTLTDLVRHLCAEDGR